MISKEEFFLILGHLKQRGELNVEILSGSMYPLIKSGQRVQIEPATGKLKTGEIIVYFVDGVFNCHVFLKYVGENGSSMVTIGLNSKFVDVPVSTNMVLGKVKSVKKPFWYWVLLYYRLMFL